jgi:hypothetical protein
MNDDGTGLRQLTNTDLLTYAIGMKHLTQLEIELVHRLEQITNQRLEVLEKLPKLPCMQCPAFPELMPEDTEEALIDLDGDTQWA